MNIQKLTSWQFVILVSMAVLGTEVFNIAAFIAQYAKQDAWISLLVTPVTSIWCVLVITALAKRYPNMTIIEYSRRILGKWLSKLIELYYLYVLFVFSCVIAKVVVDLFILISHPLTPPVVILIMLFCICGFGAWQGIGVLGRCGEVIFPIIILLALIILVLSIKDWNSIYLRPVGENGLVSILKGASVPSGWQGEIIIIAFLIPLMNQQKQARKLSIVTTVIVTLFMLKTVLICTLVAGPLVSKLYFPYAAVIRNIDLGDVLERIDPVFIPIWVSCGFLKLATFIFVTSFCLGRICSIKNQRTVTLPMTLIIFAGALWTMKSVPGVDDLLQFYYYSFPVVSLISAILIPTALLLIDQIRSGWRAVHGNK